MIIISLNQAEAVLSTERVDSLHIVRGDKAEGQQIEVSWIKKTTR